jgi:hypothetical protein
MSVDYYAFLNLKNIVVEVIPGPVQANSGINWETYYTSQRGLTCKRTAIDGSIRKNYAGIGFKYSPELDAFIPPLPGPSEYWVLLLNTCRWIQTPAGTQYYIVEAVKGHIQSVVSQRQYDSIVSLKSYLQSTNPQWAAEAAAGNVWNDAVWAKVIDIQTQVASGQRPIPTPTEVIAELPVIQWPQA